MSSGGIVAFGLSSLEPASVFDEDCEPESEDFDEAPLSEEPESLLSPEPSIT